MSQENSVTQTTPVAQTTTQVVVTEPKPAANQEMSIHELATAMKSMIEDIGQISELASEEKLLVSEFFASLLKLMQPLASSMPVSISALPAEAGNIVRAYIDPTGHLVLIHEDGHMDLKNLSEKQNRDIMIIVVKDVMPKFKSLTSQQKRKFERRIQFLSAVTNEIQKISGVLASLENVAQK